MSISQSLFDEGVCRENTGCCKWDTRQKVFGRADVIPLWVADMDFAAPRQVTDALARRAAEGVFGYPADDPEDFRAVTRWMRDRHGVSLNEDSVFFSPGVVDSMNVALGALTRPGDTVVVLTPVYGPFYEAAKRNGLTVVRCPLIHEGGDWRMDLDAVEAAFRNGAKALLLCNPHNPVGRIWTRAELEALAALARQYDVRIISDEIHADLEMPGHKNTSILLVEPRAVALISATKTFNLAALRNSSVLIPDEETRNRVKDEFYRRGIDGINLFGVLAQRVAYEQGGPWLDALLQYLDGTRAWVEQFLQENLPEIGFSHLQGTYLMWLDMRALGMEHSGLVRFLVDQAGLGLNSGLSFGEEGAGFMRLNIATPRANIVRAMEQLMKAVKAR